MDTLYLLIPVSAVLILIIVAIFGWAVYSGQFEDVEREGERFLDADESASPPRADAPSKPPF
jgi:cbb3-type cytochrome oxidase maturation protein